MYPAMTDGERTYKNAPPIHCTVTNWPERWQPRITIYDTRPTHARTPVDLLESVAFLTHRRRRPTAAPQAAVDAATFHSAVVLSVWTPTTLHGVPFPRAAR